MWRSEQISQDEADDPYPGEVVKKLTPEEHKKLLSGKMPYGEFAVLLKKKGKT